MKEAGINEATATAARSDERPTIGLLHLLPMSAGHPCAYLPGQIARDRGFSVTRLTVDVWQALLEAGWRRAGAMIYQPACPFCSSCVPLRIPAGRLAMSRRHRRVMRANADLIVEVVPMQVTDERAELYRRYITTRHNGMMTGSRREFEQFLGMSPVDTVEIECRDAKGRLLSVGSVDRTSAGWSCVYCYFDPEESRRQSLGTFNVLCVVRLCREMCPAGDEARVYLGYWVDGSKTMGYKAEFRPHEVLNAGGVWVEVK